jgi:hypothetical protein
VPTRPLFLRVCSHGPRCSGARRLLPLDADALVQEAIWLADRGTPYSDFIRSDDPEGWRACIFKPYRAEVERHLGAL